MENQAHKMTPWRRLLKKIRRLNCICDQVQKSRGVGNFYCPRHGWKHNIVSFPGSEAWARKRIRENGSLSHLIGTLEGKPVDMGHSMTFTPSIPALKEAVENTISLPHFQKSVMIMAATRPSAWRRLWSRIRRIFRPGTRVKITGIDSVFESLGEGVKRSLNKRVRAAIKEGMKKEEARTLADLENIAKRAEDRKIREIYEIGRDGSSAEDLSTKDAAFPFSVPTTEWYLKDSQPLGPGDVIIRGKQAGAFLIYRKWELKTLRELAKEFTREHDLDSTAQQRLDLFCQLVANQADYMGASHSDSHNISHKKTLTETDLFGVDSAEIVGDPSPGEND